MKGHFFKHLKLHDLIVERQPKLVVECGAGNGDCTRLLVQTAQEVPYELIVISDKELPDLKNRCRWITGISYVELEKLADDSVDLCILDTDHNYWTMNRELEALLPKLRENGLVVIHDVAEFYYNTGMGMSYWNGSPYPEKEIMADHPKGGVGLAVIDFVANNRGFVKLERWHPSHFGCVVLEKKTVIDTCIIRPGTDPVFAPK